MVFLVPFLDRGRRSRQTLNVLAGAAVLFFIVMTAWGWFDEPSRMMILGTSLSIGMLLLAFLFTDRGTPTRLGVLILAAFLTVLLIVSVADFLWEFHIWERIAHWLGWWSYELPS